jgi:copper chaperone CopZ
MTHTYQIDGMHCSSCISKVKNELLKIGAVTEAQVQLNVPQATITMQEHIPAAQLQQAVAKAGSFSLKEIHDSINHEHISEEGKSWLATYKPLLLVFGFITGIAVITSFHDGRFETMHWMHNFMGGFFIVFSFFKFLDLRGFADSYSNYDLLAKKVYRLWVYLSFYRAGIGSCLYQWPANCIHKYRYHRRNGL